MSVLYKEIIFKRKLAKELERLEKTFSTENLMIEEMANFIVENNNIGSNKKEKSSRKNELANIIKMAVEEFCLENEVK